MSVLHIGHRDFLSSQTSMHWMGNTKRGQHKDGQAGRKRSRSETYLCVEGVRTGKMSDHIVAFVRPETNGALIALVHWHSDVMRAGITDELHGEFVNGGTTGAAGHKESEHHVEEESDGAGRLLHSAWKAGLETGGECVEKIAEHGARGLGGWGRKLGRAEATLGE